MIATLIINVAIMLGVFLQSLVTSRMLGPIGKGEITIAVNFFNLALLFCTLGVKQSSSLYLKHNKLSRSKILSIQSIILILSSVIMIICLIAKGAQDSKFYYIYLCIVTPLAIIINYRSAYLIEENNIKKLNIIKVIISLAPIVFFLLLSVTIGSSVPVYILSFSIGYILAAYYTVYHTRKRDKLFSINLNLTKKDFYSFFINALSFGLPLILLSLNFKVDYFILDYFVNYDDIGIFSVGVSFAELTWQFPIIASFILFSYGLSVENKEKYQKMVISKTKALMIIILPLLVIYYFLCKFFIPILFGSDFSLASNVLLMLLPGTFVIIAFNLLHGEASSRGKSYLCFIPFSIGLIINIILNFIFIPTYGIYAAAIASSISYVFSSIFYLIVYIRDSNEKPKIKNIR